MSACLAKPMQNDIKGRLLENEPLAKYTSWRVGGPAEQLFFPADRNDLVRFMQMLPKGKSVFWMGLGSNLLIRDGGVSGVVINTRGRIKAMRHCEDGTVYVEAGVPCAHVARFCGEQGLAGAEFLAGIPGTMGGALKMNAGAFGGETWKIVNSVEMLNNQGEVIKRHAKDFNINYRSVTGIENEWFLAVNLQLEMGGAALSQEKIKALLAKRNSSQPTNQPSCGSVFKNPENDFAARLIEASALKGHRIGGAQVSEKHANFIVNTDSAKAQDIETLIAYVKKEVAKQQGVDLETEVCIVGQEAQQ